MIGVSYYSKDLSHPADRRRYAYIPEGLGEHLSVERLSQYDAVLINISTNFPYFLHSYKKLDHSSRPKIIFDYCDITIFDRGHTRLLRSLRSMLSAGVLLKPFFDYEKELLRIADCAICGSKEQREYLLDYCSNVEIISDCFYNDFNNSPCLEDYYEFDGITIIWEGLASGNFSIFKMISKIEKRLKHSNVKYRFLFITDDTFSFFSNYFPISLLRLLNKLMTPGCFKIIKWSPAALMQVSKIERSIAIIPIPKFDKRMMFKPENKAALWYGLGVKVLCSSTPSYQRYASIVKEVTVCDDIDAFVDEISSTNHANKRNRILHLEDEHRLEYKALWSNIFRNLDLLPYCSES